MSYYGNSLSRSFGKYFVKVTALLNELQKIWFDGIFYGWDAVCTLWKNEKFSLTEKKIRQINYLVISLVKPLLSRNFCKKGVIVREFLQFPHCVTCTIFFVKSIQGKVAKPQCRNCRNSLTLLSQKFRERNGFTKEITK